MPPFDKTKPGAPLNFPAAVYNDMLDTIAYVKAMRNQSGGASGPSIVDRDVIRVRNSSGADRARWDILGLNGVNVTPTTDVDLFKNGPILIGQTPTALNHVGKLAICLEPIAAGQIGRAIISGAALCKVDVTDANHNFADLINSDATKLKSALIGPVQIIYKEAGTGQKWCYVRMSNMASQTLPLGTYFGAPGLTVTSAIAWNPLVGSGTFGASGPNLSYNSTTGEITNNTENRLVAFTSFQCSLPGTLTAGQSVICQARIENFLTGVGWSNADHCIFNFTQYNNGLAFQSEIHRFQVDPGGTVGNKWRTTAIRFQSGGATSNPSVTAYMGFVELKP